MGGFMFSNIDLAPQYSGVLQVIQLYTLHNSFENFYKIIDWSFKGISNTIGTVPGFVSPIAIAYLTPTVLSIQLEYPLLAWFVIVLIILFLSWLDKGDGGWMGQRFLHQRIFLCFGGDDLSHFRDERATKMVPPPNSDYYRGRGRYRRRERRRPPIVSISRSV